MKVSCMIAAVVVFAVFSFAANDVRAHMHNMMKYASAMSRDGKFQLQWAYKSDTGMLYFKMKCPGTGWCGVGFADNAVNSNGKGMASYDVVIGGFKDTAYLWDYWSARTERPALDTMQNVTLINASETNDYTMVEFKRPANSSDPQDVAITNDTEVWIMYGSAATDVTSSTSFSKHRDETREVLPMKYNLITMAMAAAAATEPPVTTASAAKCGGSYAAASVILALTARFVLSS